MVTDGEVSRVVEWFAGEDGGRGALGPGRKCRISDGTDCIIYRRGDLWRFSEGLRGSLLPAHFFPRAFFLGAARHRGAFRFLLPLFIYEFNVASANIKFLGVKLS
jgi:hypothetical protein